MSLLQPAYALRLPGTRARGSVIAAGRVLAAAEGSGVATLAHSAAEAAGIQHTPLALASRTPQQVIQSPRGWKTHPHQSPPPHSPRPRAVGWTEAGRRGERPRWATTVARQRLLVFQWNGLYSCNGMVYIRAVDRDRLFLWLFVLLCSYLTFFLVFICTLCLSPLSVSLKPNPRIPLNSPRFASHRLQHWPMAASRPPTPQSWPWLQPSPSMCMILPRLSTCSRVQHPTAARHWPLAAWAGRRWCLLAARARFTAMTRRVVMSFGRCADTELCLARGVASTRHDPYFYQVTPECVTSLAVLPVTNSAGQNEVLCVPIGNLLCVF